MNGRLMVWAVVCACILAGCEGGSRVAGQPETCGFSQKEPCRVSFRALASDPDSFNGRTIRIEGYLAVAGRMFVLSASKELLEAGVSDEVALRIRGPVDLQQSIFNEHAYTWVSITGLFNVREKNGTTDDLLLGEISPPLQVAPLRLAIPSRRQEFNDVGVELEDMK